MNENKLLAMIYSVVIKIKLNVSMWYRKVYDFLKVEKRCAFSSLSLKEGLSRENQISQRTLLKKNRSKYKSDFSDSGSCPPGHEVKQQETE